MNRALPISPGDRFGDLTVLRLSGSRHRQRMWLCRCTCGGTTERAAKLLVKGRREGRIQRCRKCNGERWARRRVRTWPVGYVSPPHSELLVE